MATAVTTTLMHRRAEKRSKGFIRINSAYSEILQSNGLTEPEHFFRIPGPIISGHADRHVLRINIRHSLDAIGC
jgi:hypothetical protein